MFPADRPMSDEEKESPPAPTLGAALSRLVGTYLLLFGLGGTYLVAVVSGVSAPTALLRAFLVGAALGLVGRIMGWVLGHSLEKSLRGKRRVPVEAEAGS